MGSVAIRPVNLEVHLPGRLIPLREQGDRTGVGCLSSTGIQSVKIRKHLVISLMSFVALSDHSQGVSTVNNGVKCNYRESNY